MSDQSSNRPTPLTHPIDVHYRTIRSRFEHEEAGDPQGFVRFVSTACADEQRPNIIPCKARLRWDRWVAWIKCTYDTSTDSFDDFGIGTAEEYLLPRNASFPREPEDDNEEQPEEPSEEEKQRDASVEAEFTSVESWDVEETDEHGHEFLGFSIIFNKRWDLIRPWWQTKHNRVTLWMKRMHGSGETELSQDEKARLTARYNGADSECSYCEEEQRKREKKEEEENEEDEEYEGGM